MGAEGAFRGEEHTITVADGAGNIWFTPPPARGLEDRVAALLRFADGREGADFVHPIVRAVLCHFWLAYEHPFRDGNGRVARALFYWCLLRHGYDLAEYLSIAPTTARCARNPVKRRPREGADGPSLVEREGRAGRARAARG